VVVVVVVDVDVHREFLRFELSNLAQRRKDAKKPKDLGV